ncbi:hypothetical protein M378DRAFT_177991 [Amanita muscaria Koide BX008]|uniref:HMG box domain-containing protein n=1 Tax=Amanita muscaria (strain Koide BX008) TaxID=946122 RepID=A0A0C2WW88_AMAMK|nr:hypothetical protein M378DRAFT_177991 [Amanita muscaria Koide BX008]
MQEATAALETPLLFAPNVTPGTFMKTETSEPLDLPQSDSLLFPCPDDSALPRRSGHTKRKPEDHIPRPPNAFILFRSSFIRSHHVSAGVETDHSTLSKIIGLTWQNLPEKERQVWHEKARIAKEEHRQRFPGYTFRPNVKKNGKSGKRSVRGVFPKDMKRCAKIAELLVNGKKGNDLDAAMQEFDKNHKMEIVTKFEEPITAQQFARSSSAPALDLDSDYVPCRPIKRAKSEKSSRPSSTQPFVAPYAPIAPPTLRLIIDDNCSPSVTGTASPSPADYDSQYSPLSVSPYGGFYAPPSPLDDQLLGAVHPAFHSMTEPSTPEHLFVSSPFSHVDTWPACSSPCSEAPETPVQGLPLGPSLSFHHMTSSTPEYYEPTQFHSFDMTQAKTFAEVPQGPNPYYETSNLISFPDQYSHNTNVQTDFDFSTFLSTMPYDSL